MIDQLTTEALLINNSKSGVAIVELSRQHKRGPLLMLSCQVNYCQAGIVCHETGVPFIIILRDIDTDKDINN